MLKSCPKCNGRKQTIDIDATGFGHTPRFCDYCDENGMVSEYDWTTADGHSNSSPRFNEISMHVASLIRGGANDIVHGRVERLGRLITAQLAHTLNVGPLPDQRDRRALVALVTLLRSTSMPYPDRKVRDAALAALGRILGES